MRVLARFTNKHSHSEHLHFVEETVQEPDPKPAQSRRDRRIQRKRGEILAAATRVFAQKGFASATTQDIANEADIGESTLYNYFGSKRDILMAILHEQHILFDAMIHEVAGLVTRETLIDLVDRSLERFLSRILFTRTILSEAWIDDDILTNYVNVQLQKIYQVLQEFVADQIKMKLARPVDPALSARFIMGMFFALALPALRGVEPIPAPGERRAQAEFMVSFLLDGISNREGVKR
jgi:AcrR family transcriptional regulator